MTDWLLVLAGAALALALVAATMAWRSRSPAARPPVPIETGAVGTPAAGEPDLDVDALNYLRGLEAQGSPGLVAEVIEIFMHDTSSRLTALQEAVERGDGATVCRVAHTLHGSASMIGAVSVAHTCDALTASARRGAFEHCRVLTAELDARVAALRETMAGRPDRRPAGAEGGL